MPCSYREDALCTHPRTEGKKVLCKEAGEDYVDTATRMARTHGIEEALNRAKYYLSWYVGNPPYLGKMSREFWESVVAYLDDEYARISNRPTQEEL